MLQFTQHTFLALLTTLIFANITACTSNDLHSVRSAATSSYDTNQGSYVSSSIHSSQYKDVRIHTFHYDALNSDDKAIYDKLFEAVRLRKPSISLRTHKSPETWNRILDAVYYDHPELIWFKNDLDITFYGAPNDSNAMTTLTFYYNELLDHADEHLQQLQAAAHSLVLEAKKLKTPEQQVKFIHDTFIKTIQYDLNSSNHQTAYSALVNRSTVCAGYAAAFKLIMDQLGIPSATVSGLADTAVENTHHAWNIVILNNKAYNIDVTNDIFSPDEAFGNLNQIPQYIYFNRSDAFFSSDHYQRDSEINRNLVKLPTCNSEDASMNKRNIENDIIQNFAEAFPMQPQIIKSIDDYYQLVHQAIKASDPRNNIDLDLYFITDNPTANQQIENQGTDLDNNAAIKALLSQRFGGYSISFGLTSTPVSAFHYLFRVRLKIKK